MIIGTRKTNNFHRFLTSTHSVLPFCRAARTRTVRNRNRPSASSSSAGMSSQRCQGISSTPRTFSAKSMHEKPPEVAGVSAHPQLHGPARPVTSGFVQILGRVDPRIALLVLAGSVAELCKATPHRLVLSYSPPSPPRTAPGAQDRPALGG